MSTRFWHKIKPNKTARLPSQFIAVDTETVESPTSLLTSLHSLWFGTAVFFSLPNDPTKARRRDELTFTDAATFWQWAESHAKPRARTIISAHNLGFDFLILDTVRQLSRRGWEVDFPVSGNGRFMTSARKGNRRLQFVDTLNYCMVPLAELGGSLGLPKLPMPLRDAPMSEWYTYCARDTEVVVLFWTKLIEFLRANDFGSFAPTAAGLAYKVFRHRFMTHKLLVHNDDATLALERKSYFGGRNECARIGTLPRDDYYMLDVNSLYPAVMVDNDFPAVLVGRKRDVPLRILRRYCQSYFCIARVALSTPDPAYPYRRDDKLIFPVGKFETVLTHPELVDALARGRIERVFEVAFYRRARIFTDYVQTLYAMRQSFKQKENFAFDLFTKLLLNSLYGKFGQRGYVRRPLPGVAPMRYGHLAGYSELWHSHFDITYWDGKGYIDYQEGEGRESMPGVAAAVAGYGRARLWQLMNRAGLENVFYVDTDSLLVNARGFARLRGEIDTARLGKLKVVAESCDVEIRDIKDYRMGAERKRKGIKYSAVELSTDFFEQVRFDTFKENVRAGRVDAVETHTEHIQLLHHYDKGLVGKDGTVTPIRADSF